MLNGIRSLVFTTCILFAASSMAAQLKLLEVRNTDNGDRFNLVLEVDENQKATGLRLFDLRLKKWKEYNLSDLPNGVALRIESGYEVLRLQSSDFENDRGGHFVLNYLTSALSGTRKNFPLKFDFDGTNWKVYHKGLAVNRLDFMVKKFFGRSIGIASVEAYQ